MSGFQQAQTALTDWWVKSHATKRVVLIVLAAFIARLVVALVTPGATYDMISYRRVGELVLDFRNIYVLVPQRYPYFPGWAVIEAAVLFIARATSLSFEVLIRLPGIIADTLLCAVIYYAIDRRYVAPSFSPTGAALVHALNPVAIAVIAAHGQFDSLPILAIVLAIITAQRRQWDISAAVLGVGILLKPVPLFIGPLLLAATPSWRARLRYLILAAVPTVVASTFFLLISPEAYLETALGYDSSPLFGWLVAVQATNMTVPLAVETVLSLTKALVVGVAIVVAGYYYTNRSTVSLWRSALLVVLAFYALSAGVNAQYYYWATPLLILAPVPRWFTGAYTASAFSVLFFWYYETYGPTVLSSVMNAVFQDISIASAFNTANVVVWIVAIVGAGIVVRAFHKSVSFTK